MEKKTVIIDNRKLTIEALALVKTSLYQSYALKIWMRASGDQDEIFLSVEIYNSEIWNIYNELIPSQQEDFLYENCYDSIIQCCLEWNKTKALI